MAKKDFKQLCILLLIFSIPTILDAARRKFDYDYRHPEDWKKTYPACGGPRQSPVALRTDVITRNYTSRLILNRANEVPKSLILENDGHHAILHIEYEDDSEGLTFTGGPLGERIYKMTSAEFHWSNTNKDGSEHSLNGKTSVMSVQFWLFNVEYESFDDAMDKPLGLAVAAKVIDIEDDPKLQVGNNKGLKQVAESLKDIKEPYSRVNIKPFPLVEFLPSEYLTEKHTTYLTYEGSMTKPPCYETVTWLVNILRLHVPTKMIEDLRKIKLLHGDNHNNRPRQPLNGRRFALVGSNEQEAKEQS